MKTMRHARVGVPCLVACAFALSTTVAVLAAEPGVIRHRRSDAEIQQEFDRLVTQEQAKRGDEPTPPRIVPLPEHYKIIRHTIDANGQQQILSDGGIAGSDVTIYSATRGTDLFRVSASQPGLPAADDLETAAIGPCRAKSYSIFVSGGGGGTFACLASLHDGCLGGGNGLGPQILGTRQILYDVPDDGNVHELVIDLSSTTACERGPDQGKICSNDPMCVDDPNNAFDPLCACGDDTELQCDSGADLGKICATAADCANGALCVPTSVPSACGPLILPSTVFLRVAFNTRQSGIVFGRPPEVGFSSNTFWDPLAGCNAFFGAFPQFQIPAFNAKILAEPGCEVGFVGYKAVKFDGPVLSPGAGVRWADDINLALGQGQICELGGYEIGVVGTGGSFTLDVDLRTFGMSQGLPGTEGVFAGKGTGGLEIALVVVEPGITLPPNPLFITLRPSNNSTGPIIAGAAQVGSSFHTFHIIDESDPNNVVWSPPQTIQGGPPAIFYTKVFCRGAAPTGACCTDQTPGGELICLDGIPFLGCLDGRWDPNATCADNAFDPPCGELPDCLNIDSSDPATCEVDARIPHDRNDDTIVFGWDKITLTMSIAGDTMCNGCRLTAADFTVTVAPGPGPTPTIAGVSCDAINNNVVTVSFTGPIPTNKWTCVTANATGDQTCIGYLPGDVNASLDTNAQDIAAVVDHLNGVPGRIQPMWRCDVNRSNACNAQDIAEVVNLLNGAGAFAIWNGQEIGAACPAP